MSILPYTLFGQEGWTDEDLEVLKIDAKYTLKRNLKINSVAQIEEAIESSNDPRWKKDLYLSELNKLLWTKKLMWGTGIGAAAFLIYKQGFM